MRWDQDELLVHNDLKSKGQNAGPEGQANQSSGDGYNASVYDACWSGISRDRSRGIEREINSHDDPLDVLVDVVGGVWQSIWWDGVPDLDGLPEDVRVQVEWRTDTIIVNFVGPSGSSKDSLLQQEIEAAPGVGDVRLCGGAHLIRAWAQPYRTGWEGLLLGVLMEQVGTTGVALDPAEAHIQPEWICGEQARGGMTSLNQFEPNRLPRFHWSSFATNDFSFVGSTRGNGPVDYRALRGQTLICWPSI